MRGFYGFIYKIQLHVRELPSKPDILLAKLAQKTITCSLWVNFSMLPSTARRAFCWNVFIFNKLPSSSFKLSTACPISAIVTILPFCRVCYFLRWWFGHGLFFLAWIFIFYCLWFNLFFSLEKGEKSVLLWKFFW